MPINAGTPAVNAIRFGTQEIVRVYSGTSLVYELNTGSVSVPATMRSVTAASVAYNNAAKTVQRPAGTTVGDLLLLIMHCDYGAVSDFKVPAEFTTLNTRDTGLNIDKQIVGYKAVTGPEPAEYTMTVPIDADVRADLVCIRDADLKNAPAVASAATTSSTTTHTAPSVTPGSDRGLLVSTVSLSASSGTRTFSWTPPSGMTERTDATVNGYVSMTTATQTHDSSAATGTRTFTLVTNSTAIPALAASVVVPSGVSGGSSSSYSPTSSLAAGATPAGSYAAVARGVSYTGGSATSVYHIDPTAASPSTPAPLVIHLHGDGYQEYTNYQNQVTSSVAYRYMDVAKAHGAIAVIPRTPDTSSGTWWTLDTPRTWLAALIANLKSRFNVDTKRIFLSGFSGGAEHITYNMVCDHHALFDGGGAMILGGGGATSGMLFTGTPTALLKSRFPMRWNVGENDVAGATQPASFNARETAGVGATWYGDRGFTTSVNIIKGVAHNDSEPFGPYYLNELMNESNLAYGLGIVHAPAAVAVPAVGSGVQAVTPPATPPPSGGTYQALASNGSTGSWTDANTGTTSRSFTDSAGTVSQYRFWGSHVPTANRTTPIPLVVHLHGDGAYEYDNPTTWTSPQYMQVAKDLGGIGIIPRAMDLEYNLRSWWSGTRGANWAANLIVEMMRLYNIDKRQVYISGFSGGAVIIAEDIMPRHHAKFNGGGAMLLGGGQAATIVGTVAAALKTDFPMRWHVGALDNGSDEADGYNARAAAESGELYYRNQGFNTGITLIPNKSHSASESDGPPAFRALVNISRTRYGLPTI